MVHDAIHIMCACIHVYCMFCACVLECACFCSELALIHACMIFYTCREEALAVCRNKLKEKEYTIERMADKLMSYKEKVIQMLICLHLRLLRLQVINIPAPDCCHFG